MSRIGNKLITVPTGVKINLNDDSVEVEGPKDKLRMNIPPHVNVVLEDNIVRVACSDESREAGAMQGLTRSLINNMILGVTQGFTKDLEIVGVGYRAQISGQKLTLSLGYSHPVVFDAPKDISVTVTDNTKIKVEGADKQKVGQVAATIRRFRKPEPYKGKGIRYAGEHITLKEGKTVA